MRNRWINYFIYASIFFVIVALINADYLAIPEIKNPIYLVLSFIMLFIGFLANAYSWKCVLSASNYPVNTSAAVLSIGLSIFGKYIPGKLWVIIGRSAFIANRYTYSNKSLASLSLTTQLLTLWTGVLLGAAGLYLINGTEKWGWIILIVWLALTAVIFTNYIHNAFIKLVYLFFKKQLSLPLISIHKILRTLPYFIMQWLFWCTAFYFFTLSLSNTSASFSIGLGFAFAASFGILVVIAPGGIGVREGLLAGYLVLAGFDAQEATTISVASRLWFLIGECFLFAISILIKTKQTAR